jgi:hypothetical protein
LLGSYNRLGVGQSRQGLVALGGQQQTLQVAPESVALSAGTEEIVEASSIVFEWSRSRAYGVSSGRSEAPPPPLEHGFRDDSARQGRNLGRSALGQGHGEEFGAILIWGKSPAAEALI